jgi:transposase
VYSVHDWAEVHRLYEREGSSKTAIVRRLGMSRNTVDRLLGLGEPPRYERGQKGSLLDAFKHIFCRVVQLKHLYNLAQEGTSRQR